MVRICLGFLVAVGMMAMYSCGNNVKPNGAQNGNQENKILQNSDGTISLKVSKAELYHDKTNPSTNTAEWSVLVKKSGRFDVWLSSATKDTTDLQYENSVMLSILDSRLEAHPGCDKIITNSSDVKYPYFRADSFMGSLFIQDTGLFNIQLISEKIVPGAPDASNSGVDNSRLLSVSLTPAVR